MGGLAMQKRVYNGRVYLGAFIDAGDAYYGTQNYIATQNASMRGNGDLDSLGGGLFVRRKWNNGLRLDAMFRGGTMTNRFSSSDLLVNNAPSHFRLNNAYWGANVGLHHEMKFRRGTFDTYGRYGWLMASGGDAVFSTNEDVQFHAIYSHRLTAGGRWTRQQTSQFAWYVGAAYEHEFDGASSAVEHHSGNNFVLDGLTLRGGTGIGEIGVILKNEGRFYLTTGLEGYVGKREGGSAFITATWKW
jgi:hypothetical protein